MQLALTIVPLDLLEEREEVQAGVSFAALADHLATGHLERRVQAGQAIALVVVGLSGRQAGPQRQQGLRATERLDLGLLVQALRPAPKLPGEPRAHTHCGADHGTNTGLRLLEHHKRSSAAIARPLKPQREKQYPRSDVRAKDKES